MAKTVHDDVLDGALDVIKQNVKSMSACAGQPANAAAAAAGLAIVSVSSDDFSIADDSTVGGRKVTVAQKATVAVVSTGVADHVALYSTAADKIYYITTCSSQALTSTANTVTFPAWTITIGDPTP